MYRELLGRTRPRKLADVFRAQTSNYQLGLRLVELLKAAGKDAEARKILAEIEG